MDVFEAIVAARRDGVPVALATVVATRGSTPRKPGARMLVRADGSCDGTIGGGSAEKAVLEAAAALFGGAPPQLLRHEIEAEGAAAGEMTLFLEPLVPLPELIIFGAGHVGTALAEIAKLLAFQVTVVDNRPDFASARRLPWADRVMVEAYGRAVEKLFFCASTYIVITTQQHAFDFEVLEACAVRPHAYLGMIGSAKKVAAAAERLKAAGVPEATIRNIHAPIGIDLPAQTPAEIAVAIAAELLSVRAEAGTGS